MPWLWRSSLMSYNFHVTNAHNNNKNNDDVDEKKNSKSTFHHASRWDYKFRDGNRWILTCVAVLLALFLLSVDRMKFIASRDVFQLFETKWTFSQYQRLMIHLYCLLRSIEFKSPAECDRRAHKMHSRHDAFASRVAWNYAMFIFCARKSKINKLRIVYKIIFAQIDWTEYTYTHVYNVIWVKRNYSMQAHTRNTLYFICFNFLVDSLRWIKSIHYYLDSTHCRSTK